MNTKVTSPGKKDIVPIVIIVLFHLVGLVGFTLPSLNVLFLKIVPWHILLMLAVILWSHETLNSKFLQFALLIFMLGFAAELFGVHTGLIFGDYAYGETLGIKLSGIPLIIGVNWFLLIYSVAVTLQRSRIKNIFLRLLIGASLLVMLDMLIEPIAIRFDYWQWAGAIPLKNYLGWFVLSAVMLYIFERFNFKRQSIVAAVLLFMQFVFFAVLNVMF